MALIRLVQKLLSLLSFIVNALLFIAWPLALALLAIDVLEGNVAWSKVLYLVWGKGAPYLHYTVLLLSLVVVSVALLVLRTLLALLLDWGKRVGQWMADRKKKTAAGKAGAPAPASQKS